MRNELFVGVAPQRERLERELVDIAERIAELERRRRVVWVQVSELREPEEVAA